MNFNRLRYFVTVADECHFGRAAARLHMAQPPLSQQIRQLEAELDVQLFDRTSRPIKLTPAGEMMYSDAQRLVTGADALRRKMHEVATGGVGILRIGFVGSASYSVLPTFVAAHQAAWPAVDCDLISMSSDSQADALLSGDIDLGIARVQSPEPALVSDVFMTESLYVAVDSLHRLNTKKRVRIADLLDEPLVGFDQSVSPTLHRELQALFNRHGVDYDPRTEASEYTTIVGLAASAVGVAVVPASVLAVQPPNLSYIKLADDDATSSFLLSRRTDDSSPLVQQATELMMGLF